MKPKRRFQQGLLLLFFCLLIFSGAVFWALTSWRSNSQQQNTHSASASSSSKERDSDLPKVSSSDWNLVLVNRSHLTEMVPASLTDIEDIQVDSRIAEATQKFMAAVRQIEASQTLISGYRSKEAQTELYNQSVAEAEATGLSHEEAEIQVQKQVQLPGASEHQTGLAIDVSPPTGQTDELAERIAQIAPQYGFILRYPKDKSQITEVDFENWHYRYVGIESAQYMQKKNLVLEEYLDLLKKAGK